jgi:hypothetical protein
MLCEVLQREWAVLYYWSEDLGSHMTLIHRDRDYFALLWQVGRTTVTTAFNCALFYVYVCV